MAAKLTGKVVAAFQEPLTDAPGFYLFPSAQRLAQADPLALKALGMPLRRAEALIHLAQAAIRGDLPLFAPENIDAGIKQLQTLRDRPLDGELFRAARLAGAGYLPGG